MKNIYADLNWRGLVYQTTDKDLEQWLLEKPRAVYAGFDPTADSLHVGSLMPLLMLRRFQRAGHTPIAVLGGATGMIGDPSGKSAERSLLSDDRLQENLAGIEKQIRLVLEGESETDAIVVSNSDWMGKFSYIEFLRDVGKNFPVNVMMAKDSVKSRLEGETGISYTEFSYMLLQAYDFVHLFQEHQCELQIGGSDQWGNITAGIDLGRRITGQQLFGMTNPLLTKSDGGKMGKTESGAVWLAPERTSPYEFYQYWINVADEDAGKCLRFLTELTHEEIESLDKSRAAEPQARVSQKRLAEEMTRLIHGESGLSAAQKATKNLFENKNKSLKGMNDEQIKESYANVPKVEIQRAQFASDGFSIIDAFVLAGLAKSKGEARRTIDQGGGYVNDQRVSDPSYRLTEKDLASETVIVVRSGKKKYALLILK